MGYSQSKETDNIVKKYEIQPYNDDVSIKKYVEEINKEIIQCYYCKEKYSLKLNEIKIHCGECLNFFHCHIAGKCECCTLHYCLDCVNPYYINDDACKCNESLLCNRIINPDI